MRLLRAGSCPSSRALAGRTTVIEVKCPARGNHLAVILEGEAEDGASPA
jgi:hypothetical protein